MADPIAATPKTVLIPDGKNDGDTHITWSAPNVRQLRVESRIINRNTKVPPAKNFGWSTFSKNPTGDKVFIVKIGEILQVRLAWEGGGFGPISIYGLREQQVGVLGDPGWPVDPTFEFGGTYLYHPLYTSVPTFMVLQVSRQPPARDSQDGRYFLMYETPDGEAEHLAFVNSHYPVEIDNLVPGTKYYQVIRLSDDNGRWFVYHRVPSETAPNATPDGFTTKRRRTVVSVRKIHCINCGDNSGVSNANIRISLFDGQTEVVPTYMQIQDPFEDNHDYNMTHQFTILPKPAGATYEQVFLETEGTDYDGPTERDETAGGSLNGGRDELHFPTGRETEEVANKSITLTALPNTDYSTLSYQVFADYNVTYE